ncbi:MAG: sigma-70 family RNA polymerase sigma factor [Planctomycetes bacterium]|nr:sigma-70 family RNA polymerase sigma factor [Planctomycetota bacterium]
MPASQVKSVFRHLGKLLARRAADLPDQDLLSNFVRSHDEKAFAALVERHGPMVLGVCRRFLHNAQDAEDACQAAFLVLARKAASIRKRQALGSWLYGVAIRVARKMQSRQRRTGPPLTSPLIQDSVAASVTLREALVILDEELNRLADGQRAALVLCYLEDKTQDEAAQQLGWSQGKLRGQLERGRERLRARLIRRGVTLPAALLLTALTQAAAKAMPATWIAATVKAALLAAAGTALKGAVSAKVAALAEGTLASMGAAKLGLVAAVVLLAGLVAGAGFVVCQDAATGKVPENFALAPVLQEVQKSEIADKPRLDLYGDPLPPGVLKRFGTVRLRHADAVAVGFADDKTLMTLGRGDYVRFWDIEQGRLVRKAPAPPTYAGLNAASSADGSMLASWGYKSPGLTIWDTSAGKELRLIPMRLSGRESRALAFSPDGRTLAMADTEKLNLFDPQTGQRKLPAVDNGDLVEYLAFSPDGKTIAICVARSSVIIRDVATGKELRRINDDEGEIVAFAPDGKTLVVAGGTKGARLWDPETGAAKGELPRVAARDRMGQRPNLACSHDGKMLATSSTGQPITIWDFADRKALHRLPITWASRLAFSPDDKTLAVSEPSAISLWDVVSGKELFPNEGHAGEVNAVAVSPDGRFVASGSWKDCSIRVWDAASGRRTQVMPGATFLHALAIGPEGRSVFSQDREGAIHQWNIETGEDIAHFRMVGPNNEEQYVFRMKLSADGKSLAAISLGHEGGGSTLWVWDVATGKERVKRRGVSTDISLCFSPDAKTIASLDEENRLFLEDVASGDVKSKFGRGLSNPVVFSTDGRLLAAGVGPDGHRLSGNAISVWNVGNGHELLTLETGAIAFAAFSPDDRYLASAGLDALRLWELASGQAVITHRCPEKVRGWHGPSFVSSLAFAPDGRSLVTGSIDTSVLTWSAIPDENAIRKALGNSSRKDFERLWADLADKDASRAYIAAHAFTSGPIPNLLDFLGDRLPPAKGLDPEHLKKLLQQLDSDKFTEREAATKELEKSLEDIRPALERALKGNLTLETQRRLERLLARPLTLPPGDTLRQVRAVAILERIGTPEAPQYLERLSLGNADARLTHEAIAALARMRGVDN